MTGPRALLLRYPPLALLVIAAALMLRIVVPAGFMPVAERGRVTLAICSGMAAPSAAMPGMMHHDEAPQPSKSCAFADLSLPALGGVDPLLVPAAVAFALLAALLWLPSSPATVALRLRPPLRGPPVLD